MILSLPPKKGAASLRSGSISLTIVSTLVLASSAFSSSELAPMILNSSGLTLEKYVSTKKLMRARRRAPSLASEAGRRCEGWASARNWATMADSVIISPL